MTATDSDRPARAPARGLGRGLGALIPPSPPPAEDAARAPEAAFEAPIDAIEPNPEQPRGEFGAEALAELTASVREHGVIQPLLVTPLPAPSGAPPGAAPRYRLIAGERRLRAARAAGLARVPVTVRGSAARDRLELALIENVQREDLNPIEEARAYRRLIAEFGLTQQEVAGRVGRSRAAVANRLRLLDLPAPALDALAAGEISEGHARALLPLAEPDRLAALDRVRAGELSVRRTERLVRSLLARPAPPSEAASRPRAAADPQLEAAAEALRRELGARVALRRGRGGRGALTIHFADDDALNAILERLLPEDALS